MTRNLTLGAIVAVLALGALRHSAGEECWQAQVVSCCAQLVLPCPPCGIGNTRDSNNDGVNDCCETIEVHGGLALHPRPGYSSGWQSPNDARNNSTQMPNFSCVVDEGNCVPIAPFSPTTICVTVRKNLNCWDWIEDQGAQYTCNRQ